MRRDRSEGKPNGGRYRSAKRQRLLETAFASIPDGVIVVDAAGHVVLVNEAGLQLLERAFSPAIPVEDQAAAFKLRYLDGRAIPPVETPLARARRGETLVDFAFIVGKPDGSDAHMSTNVSPLRDRRGSIIGAVAIFRDISRRLRAEDERDRLLEQLRIVNQQLVVTSLRVQELAEVAQRRAGELETMINSFADAVIVSDRNGLIVDANAASLKLLGLAAKEQAMRPLVDYLRRLDLRHPDGRPIAKPEELAITRALQGEIIRDYEEVARDLRVGHDINLLVSAAPIRDSGGAIVGAVEVLSDITGIREIDKLKDEFIAVAAHELKTPVAVMKGYAQALLRGAEDITPARHKMIEAINRGADRIDRVVKDLLDISQLHLGRLELEMEEIDLPKLVGEIVDLMALTTAKHRVRVTEAEPAVVPGDRDHLEQVLTNLLDNAIKYSPRGGDIDVTVAVRGGEAIVSVRDHGIGIPKRKQAGITQRFYRAHTGTPYDYGGMGVGLFISKEIVSQHSGRLWFESEEGKGSTFYFCLPLRGERAAT